MVDEKIGCEVAAYVWVGKHCPERSVDRTSTGLGSPTIDSYTPLLTVPAYHAH